MAVERSIRGTGLTASETVSFAGDPDADEQALHDELMKAHTLDGRLEQILATCADVLSAAGLPSVSGSYLVDKEGEWRPCDRLVGGLTYTVSVWTIAERRGHEVDGRIGFAARMLDDVYWLRQRLASGNTEGALMMMFYLATKWAEARIKFEWEDDALSGRRQRQYLDERREYHNQQRHAERAAEWKRWNEEAATIWQAAPHLSASAVAARVKARLRLPDSARTIRSRLQNVGEAG